MGGVGVLIVGGLYTNWGTTAGAYAALSSGTVLATTGMLLEHFCEDWFGVEFPLTGQEVYFYAMMVSVSMYVLFSCLGKRTVFNLDKLLHRGEYRVMADHEAGVGVATATEWSWKVALGITDEFTKGDKLIYGITLGKSAIFFSMWIIMTVYALVVGLSNEGWAYYHQYVNMWFYIISSFFIAVWLSIGGMRVSLVCCTI
ncbi:MAG: SSS family solute:Na+ symporter [Candidatus Latescibacterota bacterium]